MTRAFFAFTALCFAACGSSTEPTTRALRLGRYTYTSIVGTGTLTVTYATNDSVAGTWNVPSSTGGMVGPVGLGFWNADAFVLYGEQRNTIGGVVFASTQAHRVTRDSCTVRTVASGEPTRPCTLTYVGP